MIELPWLSVACFAIALFWLGRIMGYRKSRRTYMQLERMMRRTIRDAEKAKDEYDQAHAELPV